MHSLMVYGSGVKSTENGFLNLVSSSEFTKPIRDILDKYPDLINAKSDDGNAWHYAQFVEILDYLFKVTPGTINEQDKLGYTPLHLAVLKNRVQKYRKLVSLNAKQDIVNYNGDTLLHSAAKALDFQAINYFYNGQDALQVNDQGLTFIDVVLLNYPRLRILSQLIRCGGDLTKLEKNQVNMFSNHYLSLEDEPYAIISAKEFPNDYVFQKGIYYVSPDPLQYEINVMYITAKDEIKVFGLIDNANINSSYEEPPREPKSIFRFKTDYEDIVDEVNQKSSLDLVRQNLYKELNIGEQLSEARIRTVGEWIKKHRTAESLYEKEECIEPEIFEYIKMNINSPSSTLSAIKKLDVALLSSLRDSLGNTLLHHTIRSASLDEVSLYLLENGCGANTKNNYARSPMFYALVLDRETRKWSALLTKVLGVSNKVQSNIFLSLSNKTMFLEGDSVERVNNTSQIILKGTASLAIQTLNHGQLVPFDQSGVVRFMSNICNNNSVMTRLSNEYSRQKKIFLACKEAIIKDQNLDCLSSISEEINSKDERNNTLVHYAAQYKNLNALCLLFRHTPNLNTRNSDGKKPLDLLETEEPLLVVNYLLKNAALLANLEIINEVLSFASTKKISIQETSIFECLASLASQVNQTKEGGTKPPRSVLNDHGFPLATKSAYLSLLSQLLIDTKLVLDLVKNHKSIFDFCSVGQGADLTSISHLVTKEILLSTVVNSVLTQAEKFDVFKYLKTFVRSEDERLATKNRNSKISLEFFYEKELFYDQFYILDMIEKRNDPLILHSILSIFPNLLVINEEDPYREPIDKNRKLICLFLMTQDKYNLPEQRRLAAEYIYANRFLKDIHADILQLFDKELTVLKEEEQKKNANIELPLSVESFEFDLSIDCSLNFISSNVDNPDAILIPSFEVDLNADLQPGQDARNAD